MNSSALISVGIGRQTGLQAGENVGSVDDILIAGKGDYEVVFVLLVRFIWAVLE